MKPAKTSSSMETKTPSLSRGCEARNACNEQGSCQGDRTQLFHETSPFDERPKRNLRGNDQFSTGLGVPSENHMTKATSKRFAGKLGESAMVAYFVVQATIKDEPQFQRYREAVVPLIASFDGRLTARGAKVEVLEGELGGVIRRFT